MLQTKRQDVQALAVVVQDVAQNLSPHAVTTLVAHPDAVQSALAVAADVLAAKEAGANIEIIRGAKPHLVAAREADQHSRRAYPARKAGGATHLAGTCQPRRSQDPPIRSRLAEKRAHHRLAGGQARLCLSRRPVRRPRPASRRAGSHRRAFR